MAERPILFNGAMVRAILAGRKTQTRRAIRPQPYIDGSGNFCWNGIIFGQDIAGVPLARALASQNPRSRTGRVLCPFGKIGDRLWVRERAAFYWGGWHYFADGPSEWGPDVSPRTFNRPSIHMPRAACRLVLEITGVRVERLQAISDSDALAEGIEELNGRYSHNGGSCKCRTPAGSFHELWTSTGGDWDSNPWVWVIEFKRIDSPQEASDA